MRLKNILIILTTITVAALGINKDAALAQNSKTIPKVVQLPKGTYLRGDVTGVGEQDERPVMRVSVKSFSMMATEVTKEQYYLYLQATNQGGKAPSKNDANKPITNITWGQAKDYAKWLSLLTGDRWRLPSEKEWEYAARAGAILSYQHDKSAEYLCEAGNIADLAGKGQNPAWDVTNCNDGQAGLADASKYKPNSFGLYDMHGNVWEWTDSCYKPYGETQGIFSTCKQRVMRGGSYQTPANMTRLSNREARSPDDKFQDVGFRLVRD